MIKFGIFALACFGCFLSVESNTDEAIEKFHKNWGRFMNDEFCNKKPEMQKKFLECSELLSLPMKRLIMDKTRKGAMGDAIKVMCTDPMTTEEIAKEAKLNKEKMEIGTTRMNELEACRKKYHT